MGTITAFSFYQKEKKESWEGAQQVGVVTKRSGNTIPRLDRPVGSFGNRIANYWAFLALRAASFFSLLFLAGSSPASVSKTQSHHLKLDA